MLLCNILTHTWLKTAAIYYLTVSVGLESWQCIAGSSAQVLIRLQPVWLGSQTTLNWGRSISKLPRVIDGTVPCRCLLSAGDCPRVVGAAYSSLLHRVPQCGCLPPQNQRWGRKGGRASQALQTYVTESDNYISRYMWSLDPITLPRSIGGKSQVLCTLQRRGHTSAWVPGIRGMEVTSRVCYTHLF